jgi:hypothetical protein
MRSVLKDDVLCFSHFCGIRITPWCRAGCTVVISVWWTRGHRFGGGGCAVLFFLPALVSCDDAYSLQLFQRGTLPGSSLFPVVC